MERTSHVSDDRMTMTRGKGRFRIAGDLALADG